MLDDSKWNWGPLSAQHSQEIQFRWTCTRISNSVLVLNLWPYLYPLKGDCSGNPLLTSTYFPLLYWVLDPLWLRIRNWKGLWGKVMKKLWLQLAVRTWSYPPFLDPYYYGSNTVIIWVRFESCRRIDHANVRSKQWLQRITIMSLMWNTANKWNILKRNILFICRVLFAFFATMEVLNKEVFVDSPS